MWPTCRHPPLRYPASRHAVDGWIAPKLKTKGALTRLEPLTITSHSTCDTMKERHVCKRFAATRVPISKCTVAQVYC